MQTHSTNEQRRALLKTGGLGAAAAFLLPALRMTVPPTAAEAANVKIVNDFCASWSSRSLDQITAFLSSDCVYRGTETAPPAVGRVAIIDRIKGPVGRAEKVEFEVLETFARGPIVVNDRVDRFITADRTGNFHAVGVFYLKDGKIAEWTDYVIRDR